MAEKFVAKKNSARNRTAVTLIALFLLLTVATTLVALPVANAQTTKKTYAFIGATPNPIGVDQETLFHVGITDPHPGGAGYGWEGLSVTIERSDGITETITDIKTDPSGGTGVNWVPTVAGNYTLQVHFPEQTYKDIVYLASTSEKLTLVVQEEPIPYYPAHPLPTEYWTRPIDAQHREWYTIAGNWLVPALGGVVAPYNDDAPETAHILWAKQLKMGGLVGGEFDSYSFFCGDSYQPEFGQSVIIGGILYYNRFQRVFQGGIPAQGIVAVDLHTGEELWFRNNSRLAFGQVLYWSGYNMHGAFPYVWETVGTTWHAYDAFTGEWVYAMTGVPSGTEVRGPNGEILRYIVNTANGWMALWNSTAVVTAVTNTAIPYGPGSWAPFGRTFNATAKGVWTWNVTIPMGLPGSVRAILDDRVIGASISTTEVISWGLSLKPGQEGLVLFNNTWEAPADWAAGNQTITWCTQSLEDGVFTLFLKETRAHFGFSLDTGKFLWGPTESQPQLDMYLYGYQNTIAYGKLYSVGMSGVLHCYNVTTGELLWTYENKDPYTEILWSNNWPTFIAFITDGKVYMFDAEHLPLNPKPRGAPFICVDAETGEEIWKIDGGFRGTKRDGTPIIGDSIIAMQDTYDQRIYAVGKGPSATTVTAGPEVSVHGSSVLVKGMVTDISPGTNDAGLTMRFPNGVPAVADENMSDWMLYVYKQFERPADVVGVEVVVEVLDPNNNYYEVGRTTSDSDGFFKLAFTPAVPGEYTIIATFDGSKSYYGSRAETAINVEDAPAETPPPTPTPASVADMYFLPVSTGIIIAIIVVGLLLFLLLRKR